MTGAAATPDGPGLDPAQAGAALVDPSQADSSRPDPAHVDSVPSGPALASASRTELPVFARIHGEPLTKLPSDLYIPPDALEILLEAFEGPLDLLLYLIRRQNFDILDIPMAEVTRQYISYVEEIRGRNLELAAEYLLMAAVLIDIKSRMLLPVKRVDTDEEVEDPRAELARRLLEYERIKIGATRIDAIPQEGRDFVRAQVFVDQAVVVRLPEVSAEELRDAWADIVRRAKLVQHHRIEREELSVREHMSNLLRSLKTRRFAEFADLFDVSLGVPVMVVTFIAMLELARENLLQVTQAAPFAPIYVRLAYQPS